MSLVLTQHITSLMRILFFTKFMVSSWPFHSHHCTAERSFSVLKRIKSRPLEQEALLLIAIEHQIAGQIDRYVIIDLFGTKARDRSWQHSGDVYARINPTLGSPPMYKIISCHEIDRTILTRYRVGCHKLKIQNGRTVDFVERANRLCSCETDVQTIQHVLFECPRTENLRRAQNIEDENLETFF